MPAIQTRQEGQPAAVRALSWKAQNGLHLRFARLLARRRGQFVNIRDGSVDWPVVRAALDKIGYSGWMTIEGGDLSMAKHSRRLDLIIAGE